MDACEFPSAIHTSSYNVVLHIIAGDNKNNEEWDPRPTELAWKKITIKRKNSLHYERITGQRDRN